MTDQLLKIDADDGKSIYYLFNQAERDPGKKLAIIAHGMTGRPREFIHVMAKRHLTRNGYDVARVQFYCGEENARRLKDCTAAIHAQDLNTLTNYFRDKYPYIAMAGHSYGGLSMLLANPDIDVACFWDPAFQPSLHDNAAPLPGTDLYTLDWGQNQLVNKAIVDEARGFASNPPVTQAAAFKAPALVILGGPSSSGRDRGALYDALGSVKLRHDIREADHQFTVDDTVEQLLAHTTRWFDDHTLK